MAKILVVDDAAFMRKVIRDTLTKNGFTDICEAVVAVMPTLSVDGLTGAGMTWDASGAVSKEPMAVVIENGTYVLP